MGNPHRPSYASRYPSIDVDEYAYHDPASQFAYRAPQGMHNRAASGNMEIDPSMTLPAPVGAKDSYRWPEEITDTGRLVGMRGLLERDM